MFRLAKQLTDAEAAVRRLKAAELRNRERRRPPAARQRRLPTGIEARPGQQRDLFQS